MIQRTTVSMLKTPWQNTCGKRRKRGRERKKSLKRKSQRRAIKRKETDLLTKMEQVPTT